MACAASQLVNRAQELRLASCPRTLGIPVHAGQALHVLIRGTRTSLGRCLGSVGVIMPLQ